MSCIERRVRGIVFGCGAGPGGDALVVVGEAEQGSHVGYWLGHLGPLAIGGVCCGLTLTRALFPREREKGV